MRFIDAAEPRWAGSNQERAADHNQRVTLHAIRVHGELTRVELATITGLTAPAISNITRRLLDEGLVVESGRRRGGRGQPATRLQVVPGARHAIGLNIDRDHISLVVVDFVGKVLARATRDADYALPGQVRDFYRRTIPDLIAEAGIQPASLIGIGVAVPDDLGVVDLAGRPPAYAEWASANMADLLAEPFCLPVFVENDAAAAALGELQFGLGQRHESFFYILVSSGLGGSLVIDGTLFRGTNGRSGELGFLPSSERDGGEAIQSYVSLSGLGTLLEAHGQSLADLHRRSIPSAKAMAAVAEWIEGAARRLQGPLAAVNCLVNPAAILIGGRLPPRVIENLAAAVHQRLIDHRPPLPVVSIVQRASFSQEAPALGAAILPLNHFLLPYAGARRGHVAVAETVSAD